MVVIMISWMVAVDPFASRDSICSAGHIFPVLIRLPRSSIFMKNLAGVSRKAEDIFSTGAMLQVLNRVRSRVAHMLLLHCTCYFDILCSLLWFRRLVFVPVYILLIYSRSVVPLITFPYTRCHDFLLKRVY